ncbi:uncharacterized protein LOC116168989 [Photinus pyralis]|uniref:uncharacterized protein LOC116168989 n=1 Tax=Photinus pyralis TaxID=7054 RepID=UPI0012673296|nr:uncharacterized protein LOC116168989 [Photinus pyralis]
MLGRKSRNILDLMKYSNTCGIKDQHKIEQERQFNKRHGAKSRSFAKGEFVYVKRHIGNHWRWYPGTIVEQIGSVLYNVSLDGEWNQPQVRVHTNQLIHRSSTKDSPPDDVHSKLPLDILLEEFDNIPEPEQETFLTPVSPIRDVSENVNPSIIMPRPVATVPRPTRIREAPGYLSDYVLF